MSRKNIKMNGTQTDWESLVKNNKIDVSKKELVTLKGIAKCKDITWLDVSNNFLDNLQWLKKLKNLVVLKASNNKITKIHHILHFENLKALILNNNCLQSVEEVGRLSSLNSLVLSHNELEMIDVSNCKHITKLSLSHNQFKSVPNLENLSDLKELRLNDNKIKDMPKSLASCKQLKLLDLGNNNLDSYRFLDVLRETNIDNLNLKGNKVCKMADYQEKVLSYIPNLKVLDGRRIDQAGKSSNAVLTVKKLSDEHESAQTIDKTKNEGKMKSEPNAKIKRPKIGGFVSRFSQASGAPKEIEKGKDRMGSKTKKNKAGKNQHVFKKEGNQNEDFEEIDDSQKQERRIKGGSADTSSRKENSTVVDDKEVRNAKQNENGEIKNQDVKETELLTGIQEKLMKRKATSVDEGISKSKKKKDSKNEVDLNMGNEHKSRKDSKVSSLSKEAEISPSNAEMKGSREEKLKNKKGKVDINVNDSKKKNKMGRKSSELDKRSGVVKVIKNKHKKGISVDVEMLEKNEDLNFGAGQGEGW